MIVIIPSSRNINLNYLSPLIEFGARFIIIDDSEGSIKIRHKQFKIYNWKDKKKIVGDLKNAIPERNGACRDLGFLIAWKESDDNEIIVTLDDDCQVMHDDFYERVTNIFGTQIRYYPTNTGKHFNILNIYKNVDSDLFPRGFPYSERVHYKKTTSFSKILAKTSLNIGMWQGIFDVNAIDKINGPKFRYDNPILLHNSFLIPKGVFVSVCSMNLHFMKELIPAVYQLPMHIDIMPGWVIDRYGDIWGGFILKMLMDLKGDNLTVGKPLINHLKENNFLRNISQEHLCHLINNEFLSLLDKIKDRLKSSDYLDMMMQLNDYLKESLDTCSPIMKKYLMHLSNALNEWCILLN